MIIATVANRIQLEKPVHHTRTASLMRTTLVASSVAQPVQMRYSETLTGNTDDHLSSAKVPRDPKALASVSIYSISSLRKLIRHFPRANR